MDHHESVFVRTKDFYINGGLKVFTYNPETEEAVIKLRGKIKYERDNRYNSRGIGRSHNKGDRQDSS